MIPVNDEKFILKNGSFLETLGFQAKVNKESIIYKNKKIDFIINYDKVDNISNVFLVFNENGQVFNVGWIAFVRKEIKNNFQDKLKNILTLLDYIKEDFENLNNLEFCIESNAMVDKYISENS